MPRINNLRNLHLGEPRATSVTITSPLGGDRERWYGVQEQISLGLTTDVFGMGAVTGTGTASAFQDGTGSYINYASTTLLSATAGWRNTATDVVQTQILPDLLVVMKTGAAASDVADLRIWVGLQSSGGALATDTPSGSGASGNVLYFRYSTPAGDATWQATASLTGVGDTVTDTGVAVAANTRYLMRIKVVSTSSVEYYINGTLVATLSTNIPASTTGLRPNIYTVNAVAGTARNIRVRKFYIDAL